VTFVADDALEEDHELAVVHIEYSSADLNNKPEHTYVVGSQDEAAGTAEHPWNQSVGNRKGHLPLKSVTSSSLVRREANAESPEEHQGEAVDYLVAVLDLAHLPLSLVLLLVHR
jgi:hypothetical protein